MRAIPLKPYRVVIFCVTLKISLFCVWLFLPLVQRTLFVNHARQTAANLPIWSPEQEERPWAALGTSHCNLLAPQSVTEDEIKASAYFSNSPILKVDFANFAYPWIGGSGNARYPGKYFRLKDGELPHLDYQEPEFPNDIALSGNVPIVCDVTDDGAEDAVVNIYLHHRGNSSSQYVYFYTMRGNKPTLIWSFETGDRADGGVLEIYMEAGEVIIELEGKNKYIGGDLYAEDDTAHGACCATMFTRARYKWNGKRFVLKGEPESFPLNRK